MPVSQLASTPLAAQYSAQHAAQNFPPHLRADGAHGAFCRRLYQAIVMAAAWAGGAAENILERAEETAAAVGRGSLLCGRIRGRRAGGRGGAGYTPGEFFIRGFAIHGFFVYARDE